MKPLMNVPHCRMHMFWTFRHWFTCWKLGFQQLGLIGSLSMFHLQDNSRQLNSVWPKFHIWVFALSFFYRIPACSFKLVSYVCRISLKSPGAYAGQGEGVFSSLVRIHVSILFFFSRLKAFFVSGDHKYHPMGTQSAHSLLQPAVSYFVSSLQHADPELCTRLVLLCLGSCCKQPGWTKRCWSGRE